MLTPADLFIVAFLIAWGLTISVVTCLLFRKW